MLVDQNTFLQNIINAICNMDVEGLRLALPDDELYFEMKKRHFLNKISNIFDDLKIRGNTCFSCHSGQCVSTVCNNKGCKGYAFVSDYTKEHISIVLQYKNNILDDWSHCHDMLSSSIILDEGKAIRIQVWLEEKHDFEVCDNFLQTISDVKQAKILLKDLSLSGITKSSLLMWLNRYENLFLNNYYFNNYRYNYYKSFSEFGKLFNTLVELGILVRNESQVISVIDEMNSSTRKRHLKLYDENENLWRTLYRINIYRNNGLITFKSDEVVYHFDPADFNELLNYMELSYSLIYKYSR